MSGYDNDWDDRYDDDRYDDHQDQYQFEIQNGQIVGVIEYENGRAQRDRIEWDEQWSIRNEQVIKLERDDGYLETTIYADNDGDGFFTKISETYDEVNYPGDSQASDSSSAVVNGQFVGDVYWNDGYKFSIIGNSVTRIVEVDDGTEQTRPIEWDGTWSVQGNNVVKVEAYGNFTETTVYADLDGDGIYSKVMESYAPVTQANATPSVPLDTQVSTALATADRNLVTVFGDDGVVDDVYRIYKAAFNREADTDGLGYWTAQVKFGASLTDISQSFVNSDELSSRYGEDLSDESFVQALYQNVLGRSPDSEGEQHWVQKLASSELTEAQVLLSFANSAENVTNVANDVAYGIQYAAFVT